MVYDELRRPEQRITDAKVLEVYVYGEGQTGDKVNNLRGQLYRHQDGSGQQQLNAYDFKGNPLTTEQQLLADATITDVDWAGSPVLSTEVFTTTTTYDALSRPVTATDPGANVHAFTYDKGGLLKAVQLNSVTYVQDIHYDAKGQRQAIWYGNGTKTGYTYDPETFRLTRLLTVNVDSLSPHYNEILQDLNYWYDPVGNITTIKDAVQEPKFYNNALVDPDQHFTYDALYRLTEAKGRELVRAATFGGTDNWQDAPAPAPLGNNACRNYTQLYTYDKAGNITELQHISGTGSYTRTYSIATGNNRMTGTEVGMETYTYSYDTRGNMTTMPHLSSMVWNRNNELCQIVNGSNAVYYQYNSGQRIRKYVNKGTFAEERIYLGNYELYRKYDNNGDINVERSTVHVNDDTGRIAMLEVLNTDYNSDGAEDELARYIYSNHLQSASLELDEAAEIISYEEYHPYGTTAYQASNPAINAVAKRYRYTGKERDEESGLYYHGARYYIPWLCRWTACDPLESKYAGRTPYCYGANNPVIFNDPSGNEEKKTQGTTSSGTPLSSKYRPAGYNKDISVISTEQGLTEIPYSNANTGVGSFSYIHDAINDMDYTIMNPLNSDDYYSWVNTSTGQAEFFYDDNRNKDINGNWTGEWVKYETAEAQRARVGGETADALRSATVAMLVGIVAAPVAVKLGLFSVGVNATSVGSGVGNFSGQMITGEGSIEDRFMSVNWISVGAATAFKNPLGEEIVGNAVSLTAKEGWEFTMTQNGGKDYIINVTTGALIGKYVDVGLDKAFGEGLKQEAKGILKPTGAILIETSTSSIMNSATETVENVVTNKLRGR